MHVVANKQEEAIKVRAVKKITETKKTGSRKELGARDERKGEGEGYGVNVIEVHPPTKEKQKEQFINVMRKSPARVTGQEALPSRVPPQVRASKTGTNTSGTGTKLPPPKKRPNSKKSEASLEEEQARSGHGTSEYKI